MAVIDFSRFDLRDALDLAILIEEEARDRYAEFTRTIGGRYAGDAYEVFRRMVLNEEKHRTQLHELRRSLFGDEPMRVDRDMIDEVEAPARNSVRLSFSAHEAIELAIDSEKKAWDFFSRASRLATDPRVQRLFADLCDEEREHREMLEARLPDFPPEQNLYEEDAAEEAGSDPG